MSGGSSRDCKCWASITSKTPLVPHVIQRRVCQDDDVAIDIKFCGICHSDLHQVYDEWMPGTFPMVPGHEVVGIVSEVGAKVTKFKVGDKVGVGCMVDSCRSCEFCKSGAEQYCSTGAVLTYNSKHKYPHCAEYNDEGGAPTYGGYSERIVVIESFVVRIPDNLDLAAAAPLLCAGITVYSPLVHFGLKQGQKLGVLGLGGLGHMAVKFGIALGSQVTVISRGTAKYDDAINNLGAHAYLDSTNAEQMKVSLVIHNSISSTQSFEYH